MKNINKLVQIILFLFVLFGTCMPLIRIKKYREDVGEMFTLYELSAIQVYLVFVFLIALSTLIFNYTYKKIAIFIMFFPLSFAFLLLYLTVLDYVNKSKNNRLMTVIDREDFSFLGYGWYFIILGLLGLLITFLYKGKKKE